MTQLARRVASGAWRGWLEARWVATAYLAAALLCTYFLSLMRQSPIAERWMMLELLLVPIGVLLSADVFVGLKGRATMEVFLGRKPARILFASRALARFSALLLLAAAFGALIHPLGPLVAAARLLLSLGLLHVVLITTQALPLAMILYAVWWLTGVAYMSAWAESVGPLGLVFHPMRLSGGAELNVPLEIGTLGLGLVLLTLAWLLVGRDARWLRGS